MIFNDEIWRILESEQPIGERINARLALPSVSKKLYAALDSNKNRHLLISLDKIEDEHWDLQSKGFSIVTRDLVVKGFEPKKYIDITCHDNAGRIIFDAIGSEIAEKLDKGNSKEIIVNVISKWRNFWGRPLRDLLSYNELMGVFAELWFLSHWLLPKMDKLEAINRWRGPFLSRHDFEWNGKSIEVKATTNNQSRIHKIHGIEQLAPPKDGQLFLFSLRLREEEGAENTLPNLIASFREKLKDDIDALSKFENILVVIGYSSIHEEEYSKVKFRIVDEKLYDVTKDFPRIISESFSEGVPLGVGVIEYTINLDGYSNLCISTSPNEYIKF